MNFADLLDMPTLFVIRSEHLFAPVPTWGHQVHIHTGDHRQMWEHMLRTSGSTIQSFLFSYSFVVFYHTGIPKSKCPKISAWYFLGLNASFP